MERFMEIIDVYEEALAKVRKDLKKERFNVAVLSVTALLMTTYLYSEYVSECNANDKLRKENKELKEELSHED